jgi:predicted TPR repeat methyltransferase
LEPLFVSSGSLLADRRYEIARGLRTRGDAAAAADVLLQALELAPDFASAWFALGEIHEETGEYGRAIDAFTHARALDPQDRHGAGLKLARLGAAQDWPADGYLRALFDQYAANFDDALAKLSYRAPDVLFAAIGNALRALNRPMHVPRMLDLGCGTGLAGAAFRSSVDWLEGVDLSEKMIAQARAKGIYDRLHSGEIVVFLREQFRLDRRLDAIVAADVFVYRPELEEVLGASAACLDRGGLMAFTVETHDGDDVILRDTLRYAHGTTYVARTVQAAGLVMMSLERQSTRTEKGVPVPGLVVVAGRD